MVSLPPCFDYIHLPDDGEWKRFRVKDIRDEESVKAWVNKYEGETKTTWRVLRTFPSSGKYNVYKIHYRCCHKTDRRVKDIRIRSTKHTGCEAKLQITVNRFKDDGVNQDAQIIKSHPCVVKLNAHHNHTINTAEALKYRDVDPTVKEKLLNLFHVGHNPASALKSHKSELMIEKGKDYYQAAADGKWMPTADFVRKLFDKEFTKTYGSICSEKRNESVINLLSKAFLSVSVRKFVC
ncbi:hypothetical protein JTE90_027677 [Oedothorax gibbosus]|uniref:FAR1 domain-containing protein n=1 Tax=Oedothorax gibbosus TaxID=931172 RepID=A0AAV6UNI2_9ARAC|nr:hypothetical protein JTE90_027677 [Oedothorax gibbosus]